MLIGIFINDPSFGPKQKGGIIDFLFRSPAHIAHATRLINGKNQLAWGKQLQSKLESHFHNSKYLKIEAFCDWPSNDNCFVTLDDKVKDKWGMPVAKVRTGLHLHSLPIGWYLAEKGAQVLRQMGAENVISFASGTPPTNLVAGTCRFGNDPAHSVLNRDCQSHEVDNLYNNRWKLHANRRKRPLYLDYLRKMHFELQIKFLSRLKNSKLQV